MEVPSLDSREQSSDTDSKLGTRLWLELRSEPSWDARGQRMGGMVPLGKALASDEEIGSA